MTDAHKEEARELAKQITVTGDSYRFPAIARMREDAATELIASALASRNTEVREVLEGLRNLNGCWCVVTIGHSESCIRAQALYEKVQPKESRDVEK